MEWIDEKYLCPIKGTSRHSYVIAKRGPEEWYIERVRHGRYVRITPRVRWWTTLCYIKPYEIFTYAEGVGRCKE
jgi:hypothetical protein